MGCNPLSGGMQVRFQSVSGPEPFRVRGGAGSKSGPSLSLLSGLMVPHHYGKISKAAAAIAR
jgi:hypothetical protein